MVGARERPRTCTAITEGPGRSWSSENWRPADPMEAERRLMRARNTLGLICRRNILPKVGFKIGEGNGSEREMATFGYARVSTRDQDLASQVAALQAA